MSPQHKVQEEEKAAVIHRTEQTHGPDHTIPSRQLLLKLVVTNDTDVGKAGAASALAT